MKLRKLEKKDIPYICEWMWDSKVNRFFRFKPEEITEQTVEKFVENAQFTQKNMHLACVDEKDEYLGTVSLKNIDLYSKKSEYAISFRSFAQGTGAARFATKEILRIAFEDIGLEKVYLNVMEENVHAWHFYEKLGFLLEKGEEQVFIQGIPKKLKWYGMERGNWYADIKKG
ncbi:MAG: GNAT family protein [Pygmaiobacter sp.]|nr:GNAT family protein [Pygmaiobacter sp.]